MRVMIVAAAAAMLSGTAHAQTMPNMQPADGRLTVGIEGFALWQKSSPTPTPIITDGQLGGVRTNVLLGGGDRDTNPGPGLRLTGRYAANARWSVDGSFFAVERRSTSRGISSSGEPGSTNLLLPFYDVNAERETATEISLAGQYRGDVTEQFTNRLTGADVNVAWPLAATAPWNLSLFGGFRWLQLKESYSISTSSPTIPPQPLDIWNTKDTFDATNDFYGGQLGIRASYDRDRWYASGRAQVALGGMVQKVGIAGSLETNDFTGLGETRSYAGGYFALPSNIGQHSRTQFSAIPEIALRVGYRITPSVSVFGAYHVLYASNVVRPGNQVSRNVNATQSVSYTGEPFIDPTGPTQPAFVFRTSDYWAQSLGVGVEVRF